MEIDSVLPNRASPGQSVIVQGDSLESAEKVLIDDQEVPFDADGGTLVVEIPDASGPVELTVEGAEGEGDTANLTID
ncbi:MAG: IPT/TIG domain-containing protein [Pseudonocardiaceae bacterium]